MLKRHRILLVETNRDGTVGGSFQCIHDLALNFDPNRFEPHVLFYQDNAFAERLRKAGVTVHVWGLQRVRRNEGSGPARRLVPRVASKVGDLVRRARFIRSERIDLVHLNNNPRAGCDDWLPAARLVGVPCITHARGELADADAWHRRYLRRKFDRVLAISEHIATAMTRIGIPAASIVQVYDGIDADRFRSRVRRSQGEVRRELGVPEDTMLIAMIGHIRWWKGQDVVLKALAALEESTRRRMFVVFVGPTPESNRAYHADLLKVVDENELGERVAFLGQRDDVPDIMSAADVVLNASTVPEPFGLVVIEGMAVGTPVVASGHGGPAEIITPGAGLCFDPGSPEELGTLLLNLLQSPELRGRLAKGGLERAAEFPISQTVAGVERVYSELLPALPGG